MNHTLTARKGFETMRTAQIIQTGENVKFLHWNKDTNQAVMEMADGRIMIYGYATFRFTDQKVDPQLEAFTLAAMQGLCARDIPLGSVRIDHLAKEATRIAQATIAALNSINTETA